MKIGWALVQSLESISTLKRNRRERLKEALTNTNTNTNIDLIHQQIVEYSVRRQQLYYSNKQQWPLGTATKQ